MSSTAVLDPMAAAVQDAESASQYFGKLEVDAQFVVLKKGQRKTVWVEGTDTDGRTTEVSIRLNPLDITGLTRMVERSVISNSGEWSRIVWPSLRDLGCKSLRDAHGKWAHVEMVKSGRTWPGKPDENGNRPTVEGNTFKFIALYNTEAEANAAWESQFGTVEAHTSTPQAQPVQTSTITKEQAMVFLPVMVSANRDNLDKLAKVLQGDLGGHFTVDSPEVVALLKAA